MRNGKLSHASSRALERYGIYLTGRDFAAIRAQIRDGLAEKVRKQSRKVGEYLCWVQGRRVRVVYHRLDRFAITVLPAVDEDENSGQN